MHINRGFVSGGGQEDYGLPVCWWQQEEMALIPQQLLFLDPPQRELPEEGLRHKGDKGDEGSWWKTGKQPLGPHPSPFKH